MLFELLATAGALVHRRLDANALNACAGLFSAVQKWPGPSFGSGPFLDASNETLLTGLHYFMFIQLTVLEEVFD